MQGRTIKKSPSLEEKARHLVFFLNRRELKLVIAMECRGRTRVLIERNGISQPGSKMLKLVKPVLTFDIGQENMSPPVRCRVEMLWCAILKSEQMTVA
jgi:hypothetical protein